MPSQNGTHSADLMGEFEALAQRAPDVISVLESQRAEIDTQIKRLRRLVSAVTPEPPKRKPKRLTGTPANSVRVLDAIRGLGRDFTALEIHRDVLGEPWSEPQTYHVFKHLHSQELIGKVGKDPHTKRQLWTLLDRG